MTDTRLTITLLSTTTGYPTVRCAECNRTVRASFQPAYCSYHWNRADPQSGWAFIGRDETRLINIMREMGWTEDALRDLIELRESESRPASPTPTIESLISQTSSIHIDHPLDLSEIDTSAIDMAVAPPSPGTPTE